ncbi:MAG: sugar phosphate isomerase/epimerase family protein [Limisphaerales bacterium]
MRVGVLCRADQLDWAHQLGFRSCEIMRFHESPMAPQYQNWRPHAEELAAKAKQLGIRISAIGALYKNPLDPRQTEFARQVFLRAIDVAALIGVRTVAGFPGAVIETEINERGGNPVYKPFENYFPQLLSFWLPIVAYANDRGVRIAFEHCPQGAWNLPVMGYNMLSQPSMWERFFNIIRSDNVGIEWDASHLICQFIDPIENIRRFGSRIFHVHAKDAYVNRQLLEVYGLCHPGVIEHRFVGLGQSNWAEIVHALIRAGYDSDLNIEGWHDPVFRNDERTGKKLEEAGLIIAKRTLENLVGSGKE